MKTIGYIVVTFEFRKEGRRWTACCKELTTATFGNSLKQAQERLEEAVLLHLTALEDVGERERFFKERNIHFYSHKPKNKEIAITAPFNRATFVQPHIQPLTERVYA